MQPPVYYPTASKPGLYKPLLKHENNSVKSNHVGLTSYTTGSPRANLQAYKIQQRPSSQNLSQNNNKRISEYQPKITNLQSSVRQNHTYTQKATNLQHPRNKYTEMKISYMGPDLRQAAHIKQTKQAINQNLRTPKKIPKTSQPNIFNYTDNSQAIKLFTESTQQNLFKKRSFQQNLTQISKQSTLGHISSAKKLDPVERKLMRKSSFDLTNLNESWFKPMPKKKVQRKWTLNDFNKIYQLGSGKYGKVFLVKQKATQFICALKIIQKQMLKQQQITEQFIRELKIQLFLNHPNIIKMYGYFEDPVNIYIILQVALGGQLFKQVKKNKPMPQSKVAIIIRQVAAAINQLHSNNIIHRDIKPENIVLNQNIVKLCDFGWSVYHGQTLRNTFCGTPLYVSPQILRGNNYDDKIDIWALGIMMYEMLTGENPFKITQEQQLIKIIKDSVTFPTYLTISTEAKDFVMCCLQKNPSNRKSIRQLLNHQFFKKYPDKSPDRKMGV